MEPILPGAPWLIAHKSMLGVNKPNKITLNGEDYVLWQNHKGEVFALNNICPHMQAPLSDGWCKRGNIVCPFHALEFDGQGRLYQEGKVQPVAQPLDLIVVGDLIWTYAGFEPRLPIPDLIGRISEQLKFLGVAGEKSIQGDFLSNLKINYDYNHQNGTHSETFKIKENPIHLFEENGYYTKVVQEFIRDDNTLSEILQQPALLTTPKVYTGEMEYAFPSTTVFATQVGIGKLAQCHILYPETETRTKTFVLCFAQWNPLLKIPGLNFLAKKSYLKAVDQVVEQDTRAIANLYPREKPKIRLPKEEIMFYAEKLYREW